MAIFRGAGGSGDATADTSNNSITAVNAANAAEASKIAAAASATSAAASATTATTKASQASTSESNAASSASTATTQATNSATSAANALVSETNADTSATTATTQATNAATSASSASTSAATSATQATNSSTSASSAATSATSASTSASTATVQAGIATTKASEAFSSASNAATSASNAATSESNSSLSATAASTSASTASSQAGIATTQATNAATSASNAATSASNAATSESNAASSASAATSSATDAQTAQTAAEAAQTATESVYDNFDDRYLGAKAVAPTTDNDGGTLLVGALYFDTVSTIMRIWTGSTWLSAFASLSGALIASNNLSDLTNTTTARASLGLGSIATQSASNVNITGGNITNVDLIDTISLDVSGDVQIDGNLTVGGTVTTVNTATLAVDDNLIYLNDGSTVSNPDLGFAGNYNDGTYKHAGFFRDATDGKWKFFHNYTLEPDASPYIDITHASFALSDIQANRLWGDVTGNLTGNADTATNVAYSGLTGTIPTWNQNTTGTAAGLSAILGISSGGTGTGTPSLVAGTNITITGSFPNQTINGAALGVSSVSATSPIASTGGLTPTISIAQATTSVSGYLTATDWNTFNNKQPALGFTPYNATNPNGYITSAGTSAACSGNAATATTATNLSGGSVAATTITATGNITAYYSDERLKTRLGLIENALAKVQSLDGFYYEANKVAQALGYEVKREIGVSAQQVQAILPEIISPAPISDKYLTVDYSRIVPLLIEAIKELKAELDELKRTK